MTHAHITTWLVTLILFFVALGLHKNGKEKGLKIVHMIIRLFYLFIIATGIIMLFYLTNIDLLYVLKSLIGIWVLAMIELILVRTVKGRRTSILWIQFIVAAVLVIYLGLKLPFGFSPFA